MFVNYPILALYVVTVIAAIAGPGPVTLLVAGTGLHGGPTKALRTVAGTNSASLILVLLSALMMKGLFAIDESALTILKIAGAGYIAYIGWGRLRTAGPQAGTDEIAGPRVGGFLDGFAMAIANPKDIIFFASFFPQFIGVTGNLNTSLVILTALWVILDFSTLMLLCLLVSKRLRPIVHHAMRQISGLLLIVIAIGGVIATVAQNS